MNKKELKLIEEKYKIYYEIYKMGNYKKNQDYYMVKGMETLLNTIGISYTHWQNEIILNGSEYLIKLWSDILEYINVYSSPVLCSEFHIEHIKNELEFYTNNNAEARREVINMFEAKLKEKEIILPK